MRGLASLAIVSAALMLSACGSPSPDEKARTAATATAEQTPVMPEDAPPQEEAEGPASDGVSTPGPVKTCAEDIGAAASAKLVQRCIAVSPATHPPCNAQNECAAIQGEIDRSCAMYGPNETKPAECSA
jgi:hypothetical protein